MPTANDNTDHFPDLTSTTAPRVEYIQTRVKLPRGRIFEVQTNEIVRKVGEDEPPQLGTTYVQGPESQLIGARTVPFLQTEETTRAGQNSSSNSGGQSSTSLGPSSRFIGKKLYQNEYVFQFPEDNRTFASDFEKTVDEDGNVIYLNTAIRDQRIQHAVTARMRLKTDRKMKAREARQKTHQSIFYDSYTGQHMVRHKGILIPEGEAAANGLQPAEELGMIQQDKLSLLPDDIQNQISFDFDNMRYGIDPTKSTASGSLFTEKMERRINMDVYHWFDRGEDGNPHIRKDDDYEILELEGAYVDPDRQDKWRNRGGDDPIDYCLDVIDYLTPDP